MLKLFDRKKDIKIVLPSDAPEAVRLAAKDLQRDLRCISGRESGFDILTASDGTPSISVAVDESRAYESYTVSVTERGAAITGGDALGAIYGIYAFSRRVLGVLPSYRWTELFPTVRETMCVEEEVFSSPERKVRFRGWFLNDEDLLTDWKSGGGTRDIDYPFYQNVMHTDVLDMVLETALRMEINLVIPSSFVDIDNPAEEKLVAAVTRRGLYVSQHHVEPMGVSYFAADHYIKKYGEEGEIVSFFSNRTRMEEIWRYYAKKWAKYGDRVVWQLGLRGKADEAVWKADPTMPMSDEKRGEILFDAISTEYEIVREILGHDRFYSTATLWNEGSGLYGAGHLRLPESTIPIFSDFGIDQMFGEDFYTVGRESGKPYGVYYHAGFWALGPHLSEGCAPEKMAYSYSEAAKTGNLYYSILNVSNVRPLHYSVTLNAEILQNPASFSIDDGMRAFDRAVFSEDAARVTALRKRYYEAFADFGEEELKKRAKAWHFAYREYGELPFLRNPATDGQLRSFGRYALTGREFQKERLPEMRASVRRFEALYAEAKEIEASLTGQTRKYFAIFLRYQIGYMLHMTEWAIAIAALTDDSLDAKIRRESGEAALAALDAILAERTVEAEGGFEGWHTGEKKVGILPMHRMTSRFMRERL